MKKYTIHKIFGVCLLSALLLSSCTDYLDRDPEAEVSDEDAFLSFENFQGFVEEMYCCIPDITGYTWATDWTMGDETLHKNGGVWLNDELDKGNYWFWTGWTSYLDHGSADTNPGSTNNKGLWPLAWYAIRKANMGLENLDNFTNATTEERNILKGQMLFFRGFFHFQLLMHWGGMPYIDRVLSSTEKLELPRLSCQETADRIAEDLREAADLLPVDWDKTQVGKQTQGRNQQRITKITALGYLGKAYLFAGSPLLNRESTGNAGFNAEYCQKSAVAFAELLKIVDSGETWVRLIEFEKYSDLFYSWGRNGAIPGYPEAIMQAPVYNSWFNGCPWGPSSIFVEGNIGGGFASPNARYVENYGMANGLPIDDPESGYDIRDPWAKRDPRFYHDIIIDGDQIIKGANMPEHKYARLYTGGKSRDDNKVGRTGYMLRKLTPMEANDADGNWSGYMLQSYMRLADVYLMYAEAVLQGYGSATSSASGYLTAEAALNKVRARAGAGNVAAKYVASKDKFMSEIIRERAVELGFEHNQRFHDLRRWLLAGELKYREKTAIDFDRGADGKPINITERVILTRPFEEKFYWFPLKTDDVALYPAFGQNPGW